MNDTNAFYRGGAPKSLSFGYQRRALGARNIDLIDPADYTLFIIGPLSEEVSQKQP